MTAACATAVRDAGFQIVGETAHAFTPHGATVALLLAQSHLVISTWPEYRIAIVDVTICGPKDSALRLWSGLEGILLPLACDIHEHRIDVARILHVEIRDLDTATQADVDRIGANWVGRDPAEFVAK